ncbi:MAG: cation diffusion facilitator family transporter [Gammaproteobacteria bacterium]|jgi:cobalt-zinc-cadmium efflux system protein|nr:cation diffusion facilitator family transporter [Gammaproteobacteria bacterium]
MNAHTHNHQQHHHHHADNEKRLLWAMILTGGFMVAEVVGGIMSGSLALLADAGHMLTDSSALFMAWAAARITRRPADDDRSYGYHRVQILAAFVNGLAFFAIFVWIVVEAVQRLLDPVHVIADTMLVVAVLGLVVNLATFFVLHGGDQADLNLKGAIVHVLGDLLGSVAAISAAVVILFTGWMPIDPLLSVLVALLILRSAWFVTKRSAHILLEGTPEEIDVTELRETVTAQIPDVLDVHHVHVWSLTTDRPLLTAHVQVRSGVEYDTVMQQIKSVLNERFGISHSTLQIEYERCADK